MSVNTSSKTADAIRGAQGSLLNHASKTHGKDGKLGKQDFMNLFMTQLANQDPLDPMDSHKMMNQMAVLGNMEQLEGIKGEMQKLNIGQDQLARFEALRYLGKEVSVDGKALQYAKGEASPIRFSIEGDAGKVIATVKDSAGETLSIKDLGALKKGSHDFVWNGNSDEGLEMKEGIYTVEIQATGENGGKLLAKTFNTDRVTQVEFKDGKPWLKLSDRAIPVTQVRFVDQKTKEFFGNANPLPMMRELSSKPMKGKLADG